MILSGYGLSASSIFHDMFFDISIKVTILLHLVFPCNGWFNFNQKLCFSYYNSVYLNFIIDFKFVVNTIIVCRTGWIVNKKKIMPLLTVKFILDVIVLNPHE